MKKLITLKTAVNLGWILFIISLFVSNSYFKIGMYSMAISLLIIIMLQMKIIKNLENPK